MNENIHEYTEAGQTRYVVARYDDRNHNYIAPMTERARRLTGCHSESARTANAVATGNTYNYSNRKSALAAARRVYGD